MAKQDVSKVILEVEGKQVGLEQLNSTLAEIKNNLQSSSVQAKKTFSSIEENVRGAQQAFSNLYSTTKKPIFNANEAKEIGNTFYNAITNIDSRLNSLKTNLGDLLNSANNKKNLELIKQYESSISKINNDLREIRNNNGLAKALGNKTDLTKQKADLNRESVTYANIPKNELTSDQTERLLKIKQLINEINTALEKRNELEKANEAIFQANSVSTIGGLEAKKSALEKERNALQSQALNKEDFENLEKVIGRIRNLLIDLAKDTSGIPITGNSLETQYQAAKQANIEEMKEAENLSTALRSIGLPVLNFAALIKGIKDLIQYSFQFTKNLDKALTEISIVSGKTKKEVQGLTSTFIELSAKTGMAIDDIAQASTIFYQQGLGDKAVEQMTEYTALFAKISGESVATAADQITAAINGFGYTYQQVEEVVDKMSVLAAHSAASIEELATAMSKGASQAAQAGLTFDEYNAYLATMIEATREAPENLGTSLKTIMSRMQQIKSGENTEDDTSVNDVEKALKTVGISLRDTTGQLKDIDKVLSELGPKWGSLDRNTQAYLGTVIAGTRQQSRFITLMANWDRVMELTADSENSAGAASQMHAAAMDSLESSLNSLTNAWQKFISEITSSDVFITIINVITKFVSLLSTGGGKIAILSLAIVGLSTKLLDFRAKLTLANKSFGVFVSETVQTILNKFIPNLNKAIDKTKEFTEAKIQANNTPIYDTSGNLSRVAKREKIGNVDGQNNNISKSAKGIGAVAAISGIAIATTAIIDRLHKSGADYSEEAQDLREAIAKQTEKETELINAYNTNIETYKKLSNKMNRTNEENEKLKEISQELAKISPNANLGVNASGYNSINLSLLERQYESATDKLATQSEKQLKVIGNEIISDSMERAEKNVGNRGDWLNTLGDMALGVSGVLAASGVGALAAGITAAVGGIAKIASNIWHNMSVSNEENRILREEFVNSIDEYGEEIVEQIKYINKGLISNGTINGTTKEERSNFSDVLSNIFVEREFNRIGNNIDNYSAEELRDEISSIGARYQLFTNKITTEQYANMVQFSKIFDETLANSAVDYNTIEERIENALVKSGITDEEIGDIIKESVIQDSSNSDLRMLNSVIKDLENRIKSANSEYDREKNTSLLSSAKGMNTTTASFLASVGGFDNYDLFNFLDIDKLNEALSKNREQALGEFTNQMNAFSIGVDAKKREFLEDTGNKWTNWENIDTTQLSEKMKIQYDAIEEEANACRDAIEKVFSNFSIASDYQWFEMFDQLKSAGEDFADVMSIIQDSVDGILSGGSTEKLFDLLDKADQLFTSNDEYINFLKEVENGYNIINGEVQLSEQLQQRLTDLSKQQLQAKADELKQNLLIKKEEIEGYITSLEAEQATIEYKLLSMDEEKNGSEELSLAKQDAEQAWITASNQANTYFIGNYKQTMEATVTSASTAFGEIATRYNQLQKAILENNITQETIDSLRQTWTSTTKDLNFDTQLKKIDSEFATSGKEGLLARLQGIKNTLSTYRAQVAEIDAKLSVLDKGIVVTDTNNSTAASGAKDYIGKLKEIFNLENKIENMKNRIEILDSYSENANAEDWIRFNKEKLMILKEEEADYEQLIAAYGQIVISEQDIIKNSIVGNAFDFDQFGNIVINMEEYNALSTESVKNGKSMKQLADDLYDEYNDLYKQMIEGANNYLDVLKETIKMEQEQIDNYEEYHKDAAEAIKDIYKKILDTKLDAIDKEIKELDKLKESYEKVNEAANNEREMGKLQTNLKRSLMDTSGASNSKVLSYKDQIRAKAEEIGNKAYTDRLDEIKKTLNDQKDTLNNNFNEFFEDWTQLYNLVDSFINDENDFTNLMKSTEQYLKGDNIGRTKLEKEWQEKYLKATADLGDGYTIRDVWESMQKNIEKIGTLDENLVAKIKEGVVPLSNYYSEKLEEYKSSTNQAISEVKALIKSNNTLSQVTEKTPNPTPNEEIKTKNNNIGLGNKFSIGESIKSAEHERDGFLNLVRTYNIDEKTKKVTNRGAALDLSMKGETIQDAILGADGNWYYRLKNKDGWGWFREDALLKYALGGMNYSTGPAWLDGTRTNPEAVLNPEQTRAFLDFTSRISKLEPNQSIGSTIKIDNISFKVDSMSSKEDGEEAFDAFLNRFKEIGSQKGLNITTAKL